jgi:hypothetical protein
MVQCVDDKTSSHLDKFAKVCETVYAENAASQAGQPGVIPKFTPLNISTAEHRRFFELVVSSTMRTMNPSTPSKVFDQAHAQAMQRLSSTTEQ